MTAPTDFIDVPSGALCGAVVALTCKGPDEERSYFIEYDSQLDPDDYITTVSGACGDTAAVITDVIVLGRRWRFTITGGTLNQTSGIDFTINLKSGDIRTLVCVLSVEEQGVLQSGTIPVIMGSQGARGTQLWFATSDPSSGFVAPNDVAIITGDIVYSSASNSFFTASYVSGVLTWTREGTFETQVSAASPVVTATNDTTLGEVADAAILSAQVTDFFEVINGRLCIIRSKLYSTPIEDGELYDPGQGIMYINYSGSQPVGGPILTRSGQPLMSRSGNSIVFRT